MYYKGNYFVIIKNVKYDKVRDFLGEHQQTQHIQLLDLNKDHDEVDRMYKFAQEKLKTTEYVYN